MLVVIEASGRGWAMGSWATVAVGHDDKGVNEMAYTAGCW